MARSHPSRAVTAGPHLGAGGDVAVHWRPVSEVIGADVGDLRTERRRRVLRVTRGDGDRRSLPLPGPALVRIDAYLARRADLADAKSRAGRPDPGPHANVLFATPTGGGAGHAALVRDPLPRRGRVAQRPAGGQGARRPAPPPPLRPGASGSPPVPG